MRTPNAAILVNGVAVAQSNVPFTYTFVMRTIRVFDPERRVWEMEEVPPTMAVSAPGYTSAAVDLGLAQAQAGKAAA
jgi:hypothetical protein